MAANYGEYDPQVLRRLQMVELEMLKDIDAFCEKNGIKYFVNYGCAIGAVRHKGFIPWDDDIDICMLRADSERFVELARADWAFSQKYDVIAPLSDRCSHMFVKVSKKGTKHIVDEVLEAGLETGISADIFPLDAVPQEEKRFRQKAFWTWVISRLLYIYFFKHPYVSADGFVGKCFSSVCIIMHYVLRWMPFITPSRLQAWYLKVCRCDENNGVYVDYVDSVPVRQTMKYDEMFPVVELPFEHTTICLPNSYDKFLTERFGDYMQVPPLEKRHNHAPAVLDFGDE